MFDRGPVNAGVCDTMTKSETTYNEMILCIPHHCLLSSYEFGEIKYKMNHPLFIATPLLLGIKEDFAFCASKNERWFSWDNGKGTDLGFDDG